MKDIHRTERIWTSTGYTCPLLRWKRNGASENFLFERCALPTPCCLSSCLNCVMSWSESIYHMHKHAYMLFDLYLLLGVILEVTLVKKKTGSTIQPAPSHCSCALDHQCTALVAVLATHLGNGICQAAIISPNSGGGQVGKWEYPGVQANEV